MRTLRLLGVVTCGFFLLASNVAVGDTLPINHAPVYFNHYQDSVTGTRNFTHTDGKTYWDIEGGADNYTNELWERPTVATYMNIGGKIATDQYYEYLDIVSASAGFDAQFLYIAIDVFGRDQVNSTPPVAPQGLKNAYYGFQISKQAGGKGGYYFFADQPELNADPPPNTHWQTTNTYGYIDNKNARTGQEGVGDVSGTALTRTRQDDFLAGTELEKSDGFETQIVAGGKHKSTNQAVLYTRLRPTDDTVVELALNYSAFGFTQADLQNLGFLNFDVVKGNQSPSNYLRNDHWNALEGGTPYAVPGTGGNIYELDNLRGGAITVVPLPPAAGLGVLLMSGVGVRRFWKRRAQAANS